MLKIGDFSKVAQVSVKTLRYYAELGLLRPAWVDRYTGYRYYTLQQLPRLNRILALRELGFPLAQIEQLLRDDLPPRELQRLMQLRHAELKQQVQVEQARLTRVEVRLRQIEQEGRLPRYEVLVKRIEPCLVAGIRDTVTDYGSVGDLFGELYGYLRARGAPLDASSPSLAIYYDAEYRDQGADVEVAVPVEYRLRGNARVTVHELPGAEEAASLLHTGSYEKIPAAYRALMAWTQAYGYRTRGPNREVYLQGPRADLDPSSYVTELQLPVQKLTAPSTGQLKEGTTMEPRIVNKPAFTVVGLPFAGTLGSDPPDNEISKVWGEFNRRSAEIRHVSGPAIGLCFGMANETEPWYIAGIEVDRAPAGEVPTGMMSMSVPSQKYAVFTCTLPALGATYRYITEEWQPRSSYEHADAPDFELYDEKFDPSDPEHGEMYVYWPIK
jgi:predicted transcriptional regulator YdeE/DNA-binding transcriptional MerR regulator